MGNTGNEILSILDALVSDDKSTTSGSVCQVAYKQPTADPVQFWYIHPRSFIVTYWQCLGGVSYIVAVRCLKLKTLTTLTYNEPKTRKRYKGFQKIFQVYKSL